MAPINDAYTPTDEEIAPAQAIFEAYQEADVGEGVGAIVFGDEMVDAATLRVEWKKLAVARRAGRIRGEPPSSR